MQNGNIHAGHRERMREKFFAQDGDAFHSYELLEMLLYAVIPYKDTNPVAKELLDRFGSLDGVFSASFGALCDVPGIGEKIAAYLCAVGKADVEAFGRDFFRGAVSMRDYDRAGRYATDRVSALVGNEEIEEVFAFYLNNRMELIAEETVYRGVDFASAAVRFPPFLRGITRTRASAVILAHNHPHGPNVPTQGDRATSRMLEDAFRAAGVLLVESYIVTPKSYCGINKAEPYRLSQEYLLRNFFNGNLCKPDADLLAVCEGFFRESEVRTV